MPISAAASPTPLPRYSGIGQRMPAPGPGSASRGAIYRLAPPCRSNRWLPVDSNSQVGSAHGRVRQQFDAGTAQRYGAGLDDIPAVGDLERLLQVLLHQQNGQALIVQPP